MFQNNEYKNHYQRPYGKLGYFQVGDLQLTSDQSQLRKVRNDAPALGVQRPVFHTMFRDNETQTAVLTSGHTTVIAGQYVGIAEQDAVPGQEINYLIAGKFYQPLDLGSAVEKDGLSRAASGKTGLRNKTAYYLVKSGRWTDTEPADANVNPYIVGGIFQDDAELAPKAAGLAGETIPYGTYWVPVLLMPEKMTTSGISLPSAMIQESGSPFVYAEITNVVISGDTVTARAVVKAEDPELEPVKYLWSWARTGAPAATGEFVTIVGDDSGTDPLYLTVEMSNGEKVQTSTSIDWSADTPSNIVEEMQPQNQTFTLVTDETEATSLEIIDGQGQQRNIATVALTSGTWDFPYTLASQSAALQADLIQWATDNGLGTDVTVTHNSGTTTIVMTLETSANILTAEPYPVSINGNPSEAFTNVDNL